MEWVYPVGRDPSTRVGLVLETVVDGRPCRTRADFDAIGLASRYHSCLIFGVEWQIDGVHFDARFFLGADDALVVRVTVENRALDMRQVTLSTIARVDGQTVGDETSASTGGSPAPGADAVQLTEVPAVHVAIGTQTATVLLAPGEEQLLVAVLARGADMAAALVLGHAAREEAEMVYQRLLAEDAEFYKSCPTLSGDWPAHWREGLHHDFETTRLLVQPAGGIFGDVWPSWMAAWPRVVFAEGTLDMLRLAYADPSLAQRAVLSLLRHAPQPNVPCVFQGGEYNMVAADGSRCGTSPAWCLPFLNLELLYLRTLDRQWLAQVYPLAAAYLDWWLTQRVDAAGWLVYKCTWESGEDGNPRLDPSGSGDADISRHVRPVELQATLAHAADVLAFFASELGLVDDMARWRRVHADFRERTRLLFDRATGRYRDWLIAADHFQGDLGAAQPYWGIDAGRYSAQSLTPLLIGEPLAEAEVWRHAGAPWTLWPSWTYAVVESAAAAGLYARVGELVFETIDRVHRITTRRSLDGQARPLPGSAPEYWPMDWRTYGGSDAYGWGATTANLLIRHLFGFKESRLTDGWLAELTPALPRAFVRPGQRYRLRRLNYRGLSFDLEYVVEPHAIRVELDLGNAVRACRVDLVGQPEPVYPGSGEAPRARSRHVFPIQLGQRYTVRLY